jgi:radical SAM superfamily enzyme with C-terminal helix-hairpin-helix motif
MLPRRRSVTKDNLFRVTRRPSIINVRTRNGGWVTVPRPLPRERDLLAAVRDIAPEALTSSAWP